MRSNVFTILATTLILLEKNQQLSQYKLKRTEIFLMNSGTHVVDNVKIWAETNVKKKSYDKR